MQVNREAAHNICNLKHSKPKELPCGFLSWIKPWLTIYHKRTSRRVGSRI